MILGKLICKLLDHRWRRLTKKEIESPDKFRIAFELGGSVQQLRICRRCEAERLAKSRKPKGEST